jgi:fibronectin type 3 domain-containing protein
MRVTNSGGVPVIIWNPAHLSDLQGYRVYRRETSSTASVITEPIVPSVTGEYRDKTASKGRKYFYSISSVDKWGRESERSAEIEFLFQ